MKFRFRRETATEQAALPHQMQPQTTQICEVCQAGPNDLRHAAWERQQLADRERAQQELRREIGS